MKLISFVMLSAMISVTACSHHKGAKDCCADKVSCDKKASQEEVKKSCCSEDHCKKKS